MTEQYTISFNSNRYFVCFQDRTNNFAEAMNRKIQVELGLSHPTIWRLIDGLRKIQRGTDFDYVRMVRGDQPTAKRRKYVRVDEAIKTLFNRYLNANNDILEFLEGIALNIAHDP